MNDLEKIRNEYTQKSLSKKDVAQDPIEQFDRWFGEVLSSEITEPSACTLSTVSKDGKPTGRIVLLKGFGQEGFRFFTNYNSRKSEELSANPHAALTFFWKELERQIRIEGKIERLEAEENLRYFKSRPPGSQIGAWASPQSKVIPDRKFLEDAQAQYESEYPDDIPLPDHWGGFRVIPTQIEFWQGRPNRLHDRIQYNRNDGGGWQIDRLAP